MRDILFRGKRVDNGEWIIGLFIKDCEIYGYKDEHTYIVTHEHPSSCFGSDIYFEVLSETVGQYTGLTDKNGKKVFEGDIVRADDYIFSVKYGKCGGTPNADNYGYMGFYLEAVSEGTKLCAHYGLRDDICFFLDLEVIGNIWDNSVML